MSDSIPPWCKVGYYIDAKDSMNDWCVAYVTDVSEGNKTITVYHDGWGTRTTTYPSRSSKLAPFRRNTTKYTGPKREALRDWTISESELASYQEQLNKLLSSNLSDPDPFFITQFLRGKLYIYIENLLVCDYKINKKCLSPAVQLFGSVIKLIVKWLQRAPDLFPFYYKSLAQPELYLEDPSTALALSWPELMDTMNKLFALDDRVSVFFKNYDVVPEGYEPSPLSSMSGNRYSETLMFMINLFTKEKGFEAVIGILNEKDEQKRVPFPFIATTLLYYLGQFFEKDFWNRFNQDMTDSVLQRIDIISESELKDLRLEDIVRVLSMVKDNNENLDIKKLNFFLRMVKCNYFEKRIKGLSEISDIVESFYKKNDLAKSKITKDELKDWIIGNNILELVINDRPHPELIKRASVIIRFLTQNKVIQKSHIEMIWSSMQGKHDSYVRATYSSILDFAQCFTEDLYDFLYDKIRSVALTSYDEAYLNFVKDFTYLALEVLIRVSLHSRTSFKKEFGLDIFEKLMLDSCPVDHFIRVSCKHIKSILSGPLTNKIKNSWNLKLISLVSSNDSVPQALNLIIKIFKLFKEPKKIANEIKTLNDDKGLVETVHSNLNVYAQSERSEESWDKVLVGRFSHFDNLRYRLKFIEFVVNNSAGHCKLSQSLLEDLWGILGQSPIKAERSLFFSWITQGVKQKPALDLENVEFLFKSVLMHEQRFSALNQSEESFEFFKYIFVLYHAQHRNIEIQAGKFKYRKTNQLEGFEKLVSIQLHNQEISAEVGKLIINLLVRHSLTINSQASAFIEDFTDSLLNTLLKSKDNDSVATCGLNLLKQLLAESEPEVFTANNFLYIHEGMTRDFTKIHFDQNLTIRHLRREIAKFYKRSIENVNFSTSEKKFSSIDDDLRLRNFKFHCLTVEFRPSEFKEFNPLPSLSQNQKVIKCLFEILSDPDKAYLDLAWSLLTSLPINQQLESTFESLAQPLSELLDQKNIHRLLYQLIIIRKLLEDRKWKKQFVKVSGPDLLVDIFLDNSETALKQEALIRTLALVLRESPLKVDRGRLVTCFFSSLANISKISSELKEIENFSRSLEEFIKFFEETDTQALVTYVQSNPKALRQLFRQIFFKTANAQYTKRIREQLEKLSRIPEIASICFNILFNSRKKALKSSNDNYWKLFAFITKNLHPSFKAGERTAMVQELSGYVQEVEGEQIGSKRNEVLGGVLNLLAVAWPGSCPVAPEHKELFLTRGLFEVPDLLCRSRSYPPLCKFPETRASAFELVLELSRQSPEFREGLVRDLDKFHEEADWRGWRKADWLISAVAKEKSQSGLVGLKNLGSTCYMNSMMQQIFMIESFRKGILAAECPGKEDSMLYQLQYLFYCLQFSVKQYVNTKAFAATIKDYEGNPINLNEQMDVDEFFNYFMDKLEGLIKDSPQKNLIKNHFGGLQVTELIGKDCTHRSERYEPFLTVSVEVKNKKSLQEGLESFVAGETLEGENAYQCDHCEAKVRAVRRVCLKHLPNYLIFALRRFEFDFETMNRVKLNDFCEFPLEIDLEPYTQEGLDRTEKEKERDKSLSKDPVPRRYNDDYYHYKLRGVVIHAGTAECGHYYSYIQDKLQKWFEFNDIWVREFDTANIPDECFGGEEKFSWSSHFNNVQNTGIREKCGNAYLLFYERSGVYQVRNGDEEVLEPTSLLKEESMATDYLDLIKKENNGYWRNKLIFAAEYSRFVSRVSGIENMPFKFVFKFFVTVMIRTKEKREELINVYTNLESQLASSPELSGWVLELISVEGVCKELLLYCPMIQMRKLVVGLAKVALKNAEQLIREGSMLRLLKLLPISTREFTRNFAQYHELLRLSISHCWPILSKYKIINIIIKFMTRHRFKVPISPDPVHKDIYLGYDTYIHPDIDKQEIYYTDPRCCTLGHLFHLLYDLRDQIPKKYKDLIKSQETLDEFLRQTDVKFMMKYLGRLYADLVWGDAVAYQGFIKRVIEFSHMQDSNRKHLYNKILTPILLKGGNGASEVIRYFLTWKLRQIKALKSFGEIEPNVAYLIGMCIKSKEFQQVFREHSDIFGFVEKWFREQLSTMYPTSKMQSFDDNRANVKNLAAKFQKIQKGEDLYVSSYKDSDDDIEEEKLVKGRVIDVFDSGSQQWVKGTIKQKLGDLLYLMIKSENSEYYTLRDIYEERGDSILNLF